MNVSQPYKAVANNNIEIKNMRNSNIELLRIISMVMVLGLHVNFMAIGEPSTAETISVPVSTFFRIFFQQSFNIAVDLFVMISGWYSIKFSIRGMCKFLFQCLFIISMLYVIGLFIGLATLSEREILECFLLAPGSAWFCKSYLALFIIAPVLNTFCEKASEKQLRMVLIYFYIYQTVFGSLTMSDPAIKAGYSTFSFIGLYLLARYFSLYGQRFYKYAWIVFILSTVGSVLWFYIPCRFGVMRISYMGALYTSPLCILSALALLTAVIRTRPRYSKLINWIASSCFAVFLFHICNTWTLELFVNTSKSIYYNYSGIIYIAIITIWMIIVFMSGIFIDQLRKPFWSIIDKHFFNPK